MSQIPISDLHLFFVVNCAEASKQLGYVSGRLPLWMALAIARHLFAERLAVIVIRDLVDTRVLSKPKTDLVRVLKIPKAQTETVGGLPTMPDEWLKRLKTAAKKHQRFERFTDRNLDEGIVRRADEVSEGDEQHSGGEE